MADRQPPQGGTPRSLRPVRSLSGFATPEAWDEYFFQGTSRPVVPGFPSSTGGAPSPNSNPLGQTPHPNPGSNLGAGQGDLSINVGGYGTSSHQDPAESGLAQTRQPNMGPQDGLHSVPNMRLERARATLSAMSGIIGILRYGCGCQSMEGICNHHTFACGLALPDGIVCERCVGKAEKRDIKVTRKCASHRWEDYDREFTKLRRHGHSKESAYETLPAIPDFIQDFPATMEQRFLCEKHLNCTLAGVESKLEAVIRSWSAAQKEYHERQKASLENFPSIFSAERVKW